ncbi:bifunctional 2',3'-cyclic-nucleotide 2'-phosphodiesterase/3'-nucleotidase [Bacillus sp. 165]|uniref:bifunctional 2',3'-cyclic-nucleotide 2'-phosphodiesterase/3'-nucleotidase n=1 Tax=Bacillus sp. 165 TaxID=1529117 RepID=UPI001ADC3B62|nr:bifunctional 2',3'-cyclic-nucleotide 2'-phosphodiesterase/3'-nucleotidase [Bacillus sp. 165]MBO9130624.1 bifunctional 2',3'-cyclic-nucleotide 2'-phosphodiesterase/3'-nucleotidase [Bacillus sp. 165]
MKWQSIFIASLIIMLIRSPSASFAEKGGDAKVKLRLLETTDLHMFLANYNYYQMKTDNTVGLVKTASLIKQARKEVKNTLLFDNGDFLQGNPLGDYIAKTPSVRVHPAIRAFNLLNYDSITLGNHEFNYGLPFLNRVLSQAKMPIINANIYYPDSNKHYYQPYVILKRMLEDAMGTKHLIKIGVIGFVPPQITQWDKEHLYGKVETRSIVETAKQYVPIMKQQGADVIIALAHSGISNERYKPGLENTANFLTRVDGIDVVFAGHAHRLFPSPSYAAEKHVNIKNGTINGKPVVMAGSFGSHLGVIDLDLTYKQSKWTITDAKASLRPIADDKGNTLTETNQALFNAIKPEHEATIAYINQPVGKTRAPIHSFFALVQDDSSIQIVANAQRWYVNQALQDKTFNKYKGIPILSASAPFKAGGRGGASYYTDIEAGTLTIKDIADIYAYPNTLQAVLINGKQLKEWLEMSAGQFEQIDPSTKGEQNLINPNFRSYNFDVIDGVQYQIDVTQPAKYDYKEQLIHQKTSRIINLTYKGKPVTSHQKFIVATNNYRANSHTFPGVSKGAVILQTPDEIRQILMDYISQLQTINLSADNNWSLASVYGNAIPIFYSSSKAQKYANSLNNITYLGPSSAGFAKYSLNLKKS